MVNLVQFNLSVMCDSLWPHWLQHASLPYPSPTPRVHSNSCPLSRWCHPTISSSVIPFSPTFNLSQHQGLFQGVSSSYHVTQYWSFSFSISPYNECSGLISFKIDWLDFLAVHGQLIYNFKKARIYKCREESLFSKWWWDNWIDTYNKVKLEHSLAA